MTALPLLHRVGNLIFVHAGVDTGRPLNRQHQSDLLWIRHKFLEHSGPYPGKVRVVHGHTPDALVHVGEHRIGLDTGCGSEGPLSAVAIDDDGSVTVL
jgi:serine/threonine protein phosphatase 1